MYPTYCDDDQRCGRNYIFYFVNILQSAIFYYDFKICYRIYSPTVYFPYYLLLLHHVKIVILLHSLNSCVFKIL